MATAATVNFPGKLSKSLELPRMFPVLLYIFMYFIYFIYFYIYIFLFFAISFQGLYIASILSAFGSAFSSSHQSIFILSWFPSSPGRAGDWTPTGSWALGPGPSFAPSPLPPGGRGVVSGGSRVAKWNRPELLVPLCAWIPIPNVKPPANVKHPPNMKPCESLIYRPNTAPLPQTFW